MNPYLVKLKSETGVPHPLPQLTQSPSVSNVSGAGRHFPEITHPSVSNVSGWGTPFSENDLAREFVEIDGMTLADATALAAQCPPPRAAWEWEAMLAELDASIDQACVRYGLSQEAKARVFATRNRQSLASIPNALQWFRQYLASESKA